VYDGNEELVANVKFTVLSDTDQVATYTTTGVDEPHCFTGLPARAYVVRIEPPKNYIATTDEQLGVALAAGQTANVSFGVRIPNDKDASTGSDLLTRYGGALLGSFGISALIVAGVIGFVFVSRRK
jgi:hypothetical protein